MRVLFFAYTPFQCMAALAIKEQYYQGYDADIMISDSVYRRDALKQNILENNLFCNVIYGDIRKFFPKSKNKVKHEGMRLLSSFIPTYIANHLDVATEKYDVFVTTEINYFTESIYSLLRKNNRELVVRLMDEGYSSYTYYFRENYQPEIKKNKIKRMMFRFPGKLSNRAYIADKADIIYYFAPELLLWKDIPYEIRKIDVSQIRDYRQQVNAMFGYYDLIEQGLLNEYREQFIFFEESFFWSMGNQNDVEIIKKIASIVGKENLIIKLHPRNPINRFEKLGYRTNKTEGIPWELVALNMDPDIEKVFITFSSGAVLNYKFLTGDNQYRSIMLFDCEGLDYYAVSEQLRQWFYLYKEKFGDKTFIPKNVKSLEDYLKEALGHCNEIRIFE